MRLIIYSIVILSLIAFISCVDTTELQMPLPNPIPLEATEAYNSLGLVEEDLLSLDIYYTDDLAYKKPVVVWVHGGGWCIGDKTGKIDKKIALFQSENYLLVSVNYRLSPFPYELDNEDRIKYPIHNKDLADAINWIYLNIADYGGARDKLALIGHSAGAHLVSLMGTDRQFLNDVNVPFSIIKGVVAIDTEGYDIRRKIEEDNEIYLNAFGDDQGLNREASPLYQIENSSTYPPFFIAKRGLPDRIEVSDIFIDALENTGAFVSHIDGSIYDHAGINDAIGEENETLVTPAILTFLNECFQ